MKKSRADNANEMPEKAQSRATSTGEIDRTPPAFTAVVLCVGGTDPSSGAGLPADARAVTAFGGVCCGAVSAVVAQNTRGVVASETVSPEFFQIQLENLLEDIRPDAIKTGLLPSRAHLKIVAQLCNILQVPLVVDPVFAPSAGAAFCDDEIVAAYRELLLPRADLVTPNRGEAEILCGFAIETETDMRRAAYFLRDCGARAALIKGGHFAGAEAIDFLLTEKSETFLRAPRLEIEVRGTGCQLASAIATQRAGNIETEAATERAKSWLHGAMKNSLALGKGRRVTFK